MDLSLNAQELIVTERLIAANTNESLHQNKNWCPRIHARGRQHNITGGHQTVWNHQYPLHITIFGGTKLYGTTSNGNNITYYLIYPTISPLHHHCTITVGSRMIPIFLGVLSHGFFFIQIPWVLLANSSFNRCLNPPYDVGKKSPCFPWSNPNVCGLNQHLFKDLPFGYLS